MIDTIAENKETAILHIDNQIRGIYSVQTR